MAHRLQAAQVAARHHSERAYPECESDDQGSTLKAFASSALPGSKNEWIESSR